MRAIGAIAQDELIRVRQTGGVIHKDGILVSKDNRSLSSLTRSFGLYALMPQVNARPIISVTELCDQVICFHFASPNFLPLPFAPLTSATTAG